MNFQEAMNIVYPHACRIADQKRAELRAKGWTQAEIDAVEYDPQKALDAALFELAKADRYETALRRALLLLDKSDRWAAAVVIRNALLP